MIQAQKHRSADGILTLIVEDLGQGDFAIGFDGYPWHKHADILASVSGLSEDDAVGAYIDAALADSSIIALLTVDGVLSDIWITNDPKSELKYLQAGQSIQFRYWSGRKHTVE